MRRAKKKRVMAELFMVLFLLMCVWFLHSVKTWQVSSGAVKDGKRQYLVIVDAGHGGNDPGKIGVDGTKEKDLNLIIAKRVKTLLEQQDVRVLLTRETDDGLYEESSSNKKVEDMKRRCKMMNEEQPDLVISIHQNSYHEESIRGAQVFYYRTSEEGKRLAETIQDEMIRVVDPQNKRLAKANDSYYLLKKTTPPICIVECGFLSNWEECRLLKEPEYQEKVAWGIHLGVLKYLETQGER